MSRALFSLLLIPLGLALGWVMQAILTARPGRSLPGTHAKRISTEKIPVLLQMTALMGLNPIAIITLIWVNRHSPSFHSTSCSRKHGYDGGYLAPFVDSSALRKD